MLDDESVFNKIPVLSFLIESNSFEAFRCISIHSPPPAGFQGYKNLDDHLSLIGKNLIDESYPNFVFSYLNVPAWNNSVKNFRYVNNLKDSRRVSKLFKMPFEHIFHPSQMECIEFLEQQRNENYIGLVATFQKTEALEAVVD